MSYINTTTYPFSAPSTQELNESATTTVTSLSLEHEVDFLNESQGNEEFFEHSCEAQNRLIFHHIIKPVNLLERTSPIEIVSEIIKQATDSIIIDYPAFRELFEEQDTEQEKEYVIGRSLVMRAIDLSPQHLDRNWVQQTLSTPESKLLQAPESPLHILQDYVLFITNLFSISKYTAFEQLERAAFTSITFPHELIFTSIFLYLIKNRADSDISNFDKKIEWRHIQSPSPIFQSRDTLSLHYITNALSQPHWVDYLRTCFQVHLSKCSGDEKLLFIANCFSPHLDWFEEHMDLPLYETILPPLIQSMQEAIQDEVQGSILEHAFTVLSQAISERNFSQETIENYIFLANQYLNEVEVPAYAYSKIADRYAKTAVTLDLPNTDWIEVVKTFENSCSYIKKTIPPFIATLESPLQHVYIKTFRNSVSFVTTILSTHSNTSYAAFFKEFLQELFYNLASHLTKEYKGSTEKEVSLRQKITHIENTMAQEEEDFMKKFTLCLLEGKDTALLQNKWTNLENTARHHILAHEKECDQIDRTKIAISQLLTTLRHLAETNTLLPWQSTLSSFDTLCLESGLNLRSFAKEVLHEHLYNKVRHVGVPKRPSRPRKSSPLTSSVEFLTEEDQSGKITTTNLE